MRTRRKWVKLKQLVKFIPFVLLVILVVSTFLVLKVKQVNCRTEEGSECPDPLTKKFEEVEGMSFYLAKKRLETELEEVFLIRSFRISYSLPDSLNVEAKIREPQYILKDTEKEMYVDRDGYVLDTEDRSINTVLKSKDLSYVVGDRVKDKVLFSLRLLDIIDQRYIIDSAVLTDSGLELNVERIKAILPYEGDRRLLAGKLIFIMKKLEDNQNNLETVNVNEIDLRYNNPVLKYQ